eukprot:6930601-Alexandrium_andersonii.AAC.1
MNDRQTNSELQLHEVGTDTECLNRYASGEGGTTAQVTGNLHVNPHHEPCQAGQSLKCEHRYLPLVQNLVGNGSAGPSRGRLRKGVATYRPTDKSEQLGTA